MKAMRFHGYGEADELRYEEVDAPVPAAGQVRVRVAASGFNPADAGIRGGWLQEAFPIRLPHVPGYDVSGTVDLVGDGVSAPRVGDDVVAFLPMVDDGGAAELVIVDADGLAPAPAGIPLADAAALPSTGITAWQALFDAADLQAGQRVLVNGAGGAVGGLAVQLAVHAGAQVVAVASADDLDRLRAAGAQDLVDRTAGPVVVDQPVDVLLNLAAVAPDVLQALTAQVRDGGVVVNTVPALRTPGDPDRGVRGVGFFVRSDVQDLRRLVALVDSGDLRLDVAERLPLSDLPSVHARSDAGRLRGKVVLLPPTE